jgi:hypothetical protein
MMKGSTSPKPPSDGMSPDSSPGPAGAMIQLTRSGWVTSKSLDDLYGPSS